MTSFNPAQLEQRISDDELFNIEYYWRLISRNSLWILVICLLAAAVTAVLVSKATPIYSSKASILIEEEQANLVSIEQIYGLDSSKKEFYQTQYEILKSRQIAERVILKLQLHEHTLFDPDNPMNISLKRQIRELFSTNDTYRTPEQIRQRKYNYTLAKIRKHLEIRPINNTQMVEIIFQSEDPLLAATVANTVAEVYIESYLEAKMEMTAKATSWLTDRLQGLRGELNFAERALAKFDDEQQVVNIDGVVGLASDKVQRLSTQLLEAQSGLKRSEAIFVEVNKEDADPQEISSLPQMLNHPSIQNVNKDLVSVQSQVSELQKVYGPKHPKMIAANAELTSIQQSLKNQVNSLILGINSEYRSWQQKVTELSVDLEQEKERFRSLTNLENQRRILQREVDVSQQLYNSFFTRLKETNELGGFESAHARILDKGLAPNAPTSPNKILIVLVITIFTGIFVTSVIVMLDATNQRIRSAADVEKKLGQRLLGIVPKEAVKKGAPLAIRLFFSPLENHQFGEAIRTIRTNLLLMNKEKNSQTIMVTSSIPKEGKTTVAANLAFGLGQLKNVLLIETDLRRPTIGKLFNLPGYQPGLSNLLTNTHPLTECIVEDEFGKIDLLCAGTSTSHPQELLGSKAFQDLVEELKQQYDHIVFDTAPNQAVSDAMLIAPLCTSIIYVVKNDSTSEKVINAGLSRFLQMGNRIDGVVLNRVDLRKAKRHGDYMGFYDQYSYHNHQPHKPA